MSKSWEVKRITDVKDFAEIINIEERAFFEPYTMDLFEFDFIHHPFSVYFKLLLEGRIIGYCGLWVIDDASQITTIAIDPSYQGLGYGKLLLEYIINYLKENNCLNVTLEVRVSNIKAIRLYQKFGFEIITIRKKYYENGEDAYLMLKSLS